MLGEEGAIGGRGVEAIEQREERAIDEGAGTGQVAAVPGEVEIDEEADERRPIAERCRREDPVASGRGFDLTKGGEARQDIARPASGPLGNSKEVGVGRRERHGEFPGTARPQRGLRGAICLQ